MELVQICDIRLGGGGSKFTIGVDGEIRMISLVGKERGYARGSTGHVVVGEFCKGKELQPVVLLVVAVNLKLLLKGLISTLGLTISLWVVTGGEV